MRKKFTLSFVTIVATSSLYASTPSNAELLQRIEQLEAQIATSGQSNVVQTKLVAPVAQTNENTPYGKLKISGDYRFSIDNLNYDLADGSTAKNDDLLTNRLWLNFSYKPNSHIDFNTKLAFNKVFGQPFIRYPGGRAPFDGFDWVASTTNTDDRLRIKNAYINYRDTLLDGELPWNFGVGRRSTSYNQLISWRDDAKANSPLGHIVSAEFDGGHLGFDLSKLTGVSGMKVKFAAGRGASYVAPSLSSTPDANWGKNINMFDINYVFYSDEAIHAELQAMHVTDLIDLRNPQDPSKGFDTVGSMNLGAFMTTYKLDQLNQTKLFASFGMSQTDPDDGKSMLGSSDGETGTSYWFGGQTALLGGRFGLEYNHGSKYWRSFTYAEDTVAGSKLAVRGNAYETYYTKEISKGLSFQVRYTLMDYDYTGSQGFFGSTTGASMKIDDAKRSPMAKYIVDKAQDIRFYLRYKF
jgi:hypothetical protein